MNNAEDAPPLTIRRTFNATRERVFAAFTTPTALRAWFGPPGTSVGDVEFDPSPGGRYRILMRTAGDEYYLSGVISDIVPPERLAYTFRWEEDAPELERDTYVRIEFVARGDQTEVILIHGNLAGDENRARHNRGWTESFNKLEPLLR